MTAGPPAPVGLVTYSVKPRGGVVHTLALAEALHAAGYPVRVIALGEPAAGFFRPVAVPFTIIQAPPSLPTLEERVFANVDALAEGLGGAWMMVNGTATGRKKPAAGSPSAITRTG